MLYICFAAFNEEQNINALLQRIAQHFEQVDYHVIAYNDGSTDNTHATLLAAEQHYPLTTLHSPVNGGLGVGMSRLIEHVCEHVDGNAIAVFMDADDTHDPTTIDDMLVAMKQEHTVAIASRYCRGSIFTGIPLYRKLLSQAASIFWQVMLPTAGVRDYTSGFRGYYVADLQSAHAACAGPMITRPGFECQVELLFRLRNFVVFREVPIRLVYERKKGESKMRIFRTVRRTVSLGVHLFWLRYRNRRPL